MRRKGTISLQKVPMYEMQRKSLTCVRYTLQNIHTRTFCGVTKLTSEIHEIISTKMDSKVYSAV